MPLYYTDNNEVLDLSVPPTEAEITLEPEAPAPAAWELLVARLPEQPERLGEAYDQWVSETGTVPRTTRVNGFSCTCSACRKDAVRVTVDQFLAAVAGAMQAADDSTTEAVLCEVCVRPVWMGEALTDVDDRFCCQSCRDNDVDVCRGCDQWSVTADFTSYVEGHGSQCESCIENDFFWCEDCDRYVLNDYSGDHRHGDCDCAPLPLTFQVPGNSHGPLYQDERLHVVLPEGAITDEALDAAIDVMWSDQFRQPWMDAGHPYVDPPPGVVLPGDLRDAVLSMDRAWQTRQGNFTRRLSKLLHERFQAKLNPGLLSRVGGVVRDHTSNCNEWYIEFTRDLNLSPEEFANEGSCWWGSEGISRCALKHWGGFAMRSYATETESPRYPSGRAWVQPLNERLEPISDALNAPAYVVYNSYGDLHGIDGNGRGYTAARLMAYLASKTYRRVGLSISHQYVNSSAGFLVADQALCDATSDIRISGLDPHVSVPFDYPEMAVSA